MQGHLIPTFALMREIKKKKKKLGLIKGRSGMEINGESTKVIERTRKRKREPEKKKDCKDVHSQGIWEKNYKPLPCAKHLNLLLRSLFK